MNTLANPYIARLRQPAAPQYRPDWPGDAMDHAGEDALAARMAKGAKAEGHKARLPVTEAEMEVRRQNARSGRKPRGQNAPAAGQTSRAKGEAKRRRILRALGGGDWLSTTVVAERVGCSRSNAKNRLRDLRNVGLVEMRIVPKDNGGTRADWRLARREAAE